MEEEEEEGRKDKRQWENRDREKSVVLVLSQVKDLINMGARSQQPPTHHHHHTFLMATPTLNTNSLITVAGHIVPAETTDKHKRTHSKSHQMYRAR